MVVFCGIIKRQWNLRGKGNLCDDRKKVHVVSVSKPSDMIRNEEIQVMSRDVHFSLVRTYRGKLF